MRIIIRGSLKKVVSSLITAIATGIATVLTHVASAVVVVDVCLTPVSTDYPSTYAALPPTGTL